MNNIKRILISGGTHGNELTGVQLIRKWKAQPELCEAKAKGIELSTLIANPPAVLAVSRYIDQDLNRSFSLNSLNDTNPSMSVEAHRAKQLNALYGPKGENTQTDLILDIHNTESNMGISLILSEANAFTQRASAEIASEFSGVFIYFQPEERSQSPYLGTLARADVCIEVGPQSHGTLQAGLFEKTEQVVYRFLELAQEWNEGVLQNKPKKKLSVYTHYKDIDYPRDKNNNISAMIHPDLQGQDYVLLEQGSPLFRTFYGEDVLYTEAKTLCPIFINEAAYYEKKIAMTLTSKSIEEW